MGPSGAREGIREYGEGECQKTGRKLEKWEAAVLQVSTSARVMAVLIGGEVP